MGVQGRNSTTWFQGYGENFGRTDQYMFLRGGMYDVFKAGAYLNDIPHTFSSAAYTPYAGSGGNRLTATFPLSSVPAAGVYPPPGWNQFTLGYDRRDAGGFAEWQKNSPWYFRVDGNQVSFSGTKPGSAANGTSPGNGYVDLAIPTEYTTSNWGVEGGYQSGKATFAARWDYSKFDNANSQLLWTNPYFGGNQLDSYALAPSNEFNKFTLTGNYRDLPWKSVVSARYTWAKTTSDSNLSPYALNTGPTYAATLAERRQFQGRERQPVVRAGVDGAAGRQRRHARLLQLDEAAEQLRPGRVRQRADAAARERTGLRQPTRRASGIPTTTVGNCDNELYNYTKNNVGFDVWWKFARGNRLGFGWDYYNLDQDRFDYDKSHANKLWVEYKNTMLDSLAARLKYQYVKRDSDSNLSNCRDRRERSATTCCGTRTAFDLQSSTANILKLNLDWNPIASVGLSFEGVWSKTDFDDVTFGRTQNDRQGYFLSGTWAAAEKVSLNAFGSWEQTKYPSNHRYIGSVSSGSGTAPNNSPPGWCTTNNLNCYSPFTPPGIVAGVPQSYNWNSETQDQTWMIGVGGDWQAMDKLKLTASYLYVSNEGDATFGVQNNLVLPTQPLNIPNVDNSKQQFFNLKGSYAYNKNWSFTGGYSYMKYSHDDVATNGYTYALPAVSVVSGAIVPTPASNTSLSYGNGYDAYTDGHSNIFYLYVTYKFDAPPLSVAQMKVDAPRPAPVVAPPPPPPPAPAPAPKPAPAPQVQKITLDSKVLFDFDKAVLKPEGKAAIDSMVVAKLASMQKLEVVLVTGHTDRIGTEAYNQKLSERRADSVRDYLVSKGVDKAKIETIGLGKKQPVVQCDQKNFKALIECLAPNRRVEVQAKGETTK